MEIGDTVKFKFGKNKEEKQGTVVRMFTKTVYLRADFPKHKGKLIKRKKYQLSE